MHVGGHADHCVLQVGNRRIGAHHTGLRHPGEAARGLVHPHAGALEQQLTVQLRQGRPWFGAGGQQAHRRIVVHHIAHLGRDTEFTLARITEGQVVQVPLDAKLCARHHPRLHCVAHIGTGVRRQCAGQVAVHPLGLGAAQAAGQVQHARKARAGARFFRVAGTPGQPRLALCIGIGKLHVVHLQRPFVAVYLPARIGAELIEGQHRIIKHTGQIECALFHGDHGPAARLVQVELHIRTTHARRGRTLAIGFLCHDLQAGDPPLAPVLGGCRRRPLPGQVHGFHPPGRCVGLQGAVDRLPQRKPVGHPAQHRQVKPVGVQLPIGRDGTFLIGVGQGHIPTRPHQAVIGLELQALGRKSETLGQAVGRHPALHPMQHQGLQLGAHGGIHPGQCHVGHAPLQGACGHITPDTQGPRALLHHDPQVTRARVLAQLGQVHPGKLGIHLPTPALPFAAAGPQQRLAEIAPQAEAAAPGGRRRGIQAHGMAAPTVAQHDVHPLQRQQGCAA